MKEMGMYALQLFTKWNKIGDSLKKLHFFMDIFIFSSS